MIVHKLNSLEISDTDKIIHTLFSTRWSDYLRNAPIESMRDQLRVNLQNQIDGYWSGHTAYHIMIDGGFLIDAKRKYIKETNMAEGKKLTLLGKIFMDSFNSKGSSNIANTESITATLVSIEKTVCKCCDKGDQYNGFSTGPLLFICPNHCACHD